MVALQFSIHCQSVLMIFYFCDCYDKAPPGQTFSGEQTPIIIAEKGAVMLGRGKDL